MGDLQLEENEPVSAHDYKSPEKEISESSATVHKQYFALHRIYSKALLVHKGLKTIVSQVHERSGNSP